MAYEEKLAERVRTALAGEKGIAEIKMMGGLCFTLRGNMCCGVVNDDLVIRSGREQTDTLLKRPHARPMDFTGRPLRGFVYVGPGGWQQDRDLRSWIRQAVDFASARPPKVKGHRKARHPSPSAARSPANRSAGARRSKS